MFEKRPMELRRAQLEDVPAILRIVRAVVPAMRASGNLQWDDGYPNAEVFADDIAQGQLWVAEMDGRVAGVVALTTDQSPEYAQAGWDIEEPAIVVHRLAVDPGFQGRGVAIALMQQAEVVADELGIVRVRVDTNTGPVCGSSAMRSCLRPRVRFTGTEGRAPEACRLSSSGAGTGLLVVLV